jgi:hypothetical protein
MNQDQQSPAVIGWLSTLNEEALQTCGFGQIHTKLSDGVVAKPVVALQLQHDVAANIRELFSDNSGDYEPTAQEVDAINVGLDDILASRLPFGDYESMRISLDLTAQWLDHGCDPRAAAHEIRLNLARIVAPMEVEMTIAPVTPAEMMRVAETLADETKKGVFSEFNACMHRHECRAALLTTQKPMGQPWPNPDNVLAAIRAEFPALPIDYAAATRIGAAIGIAENKAREAAEQRATAET